jgi:hypothetical protein
MARAATARAASSAEMLFSRAIRNFLTAAGVLERKSMGTWIKHAIDVR